MSDVVFEEIRGRSYVGETVRVDGKHFIDCHFNGCIMDFGATAPFKITGNGSATNVQWHFSENAGATIHVMRMLYQWGMRDTIEQMIAHIRGQGLADIPTDPRMN